MIAEMKKTYIVVQRASSKSMLKDLRKAGLIHVKSAAKVDEISTSALDEANNVIAAVSELQDKKNPITQKKLSHEGVVELIAELSAFIARKGELAQARNEYQRSADYIRPWGDFDPSEIAALEKEGYELLFYTIDKKDLAKLERPYYEVAYQGSLAAIATLGESLDPSTGANPFILPNESLSAVERHIANGEKELASIEQSLKNGGAYLDELNHYRDVALMNLRFEEVHASLEGDDELVYMQGYLPAAQEATFTALAKQEGWAYLLEAISDDDEEVPTLVEYKKGFGIIKPVFDILGTVPGYREYDISTWFLLFFTLFFAMIVGDAGYGFIFLFLALGIHLKTKKANTLVMLVYVLSIATIGWGSVTGTWFGSEEILKAAPFLQKLVIPQIANYPELFGVETVTAQNTVIKFTFIIGTIQLSLACIINVIHKVRRKDLSFVADLSWLIALLALYYIVLLLVVGSTVNVLLLFAVVGGAFLLVLLFGAQGPGVSFGKGVATGLSGFFTTFLDTISAFSNIMSYIRLFAVGMASVAIAQSFNAMASGLLKGFALPAGILVLLIGHGLNVVMGLLSVVVHGVRLNLLEFSGQLGMEWTGIQYTPFAETVEE